MTAIPDNPTEDSIKDAVLESLENPAGNPLLLSWSASDSDTSLWSTLCSVFSACNTRLVDEWIVCSPLMLVFVRVQPDFIPLPDPVTCGYKDAMIYIGNLKNVAVYIMPDVPRGHWFYAGVGETGWRGQVNSLNYQFLTHEPVVEMAAPATPPQNPNHVPAATIPEPEFEDMMALFDHLDAVYDNDREPLSGIRRPGRQWLRDNGMAYDDDDRLD